MEMVIVPTLVLVTIHCLPWYRGRSLCGYLCYYQLVAALVIRHGRNLDLSLNSFYVICCFQILRTMQDSFGSILIAPALNTVGTFRGFMSIILYSNINLSPRLA
jgi:hypothetical protein